jgi:hypothetical protein
MVATKYGSILRGMGGNDGYLLGDYIDKIIFESTPALNGMDIISGFKIGAGGDILDFSAFLNKTNTASAVTTKLDTSTASAAWANGNILSVQGYALDSPDKIAALFGAGKTFAAPTGQAKTVVISSDIVGDAQIWYVTNQATSNINSIEASEVSLVGVLQGVNNTSLVPFVLTNFV